jgi:hypothetical protein
VVVPAPAASLPGIESIGLRGSLAEMVKFSSPHDPGYKRVIATLQYAVQHITSTPHPQFIPPAELHNVMELQKQKGLNILSLGERSLYI